MERRVFPNRGGRRPAFRSRLVAAGLSVAAALGITAGMAWTEHPLPPQAGAGDPTATARDPFTAGGPATPPGTSPSRRIRQTVTSAS